MTWQRGRRSSPERPAQASQPASQNNQHESIRMSTSSTVSTGSGSGTETGVTGTPSTTDSGSDRFNILRQQGIDVDTSTRRLSEYGYDASNYRVPPVAVVFPRTVDDVVAAVRFCAGTAMVLTSRGGGPSMAGNAVGPGMVLDFSRHMTAVLAVDAEAKTATVERGLVITHLQRNIENATGGALTYAPDPSSKSRATIGGAVGNDA